MSEILKQKEREREEISGRPITTTANLSKQLPSNFFIVSPANKELAQRMQEDHSF